MKLYIRTATGSRIAVAGCLFEIDGYPGYRFILHPTLSIRNRFCAGSYDVSEYTTGQRVTSAWPTVWTAKTAAAMRLNSLGGVEALEKCLRRCRPIRQPETTPH